MDILILAAIAIYIFVKLREQLGRVDEDQRRESIKKFISEQAKLTEASNNSPQDPVQSEIKLIDNLSLNDSDFKSQRIVDGVDVTIRQSFVDIMQKVNCSADNFLFGAVKAFEMVLSAFAHGDLKTLKLLLSEKLLAGFEMVIKEREVKGYSLETKIISIDETKIIDAKIVDNYAFIKIRFSSKQINYITDSSSNVIDGSKEEVSVVNDAWTFKKDLNSDNPNWSISSTN